MTHLDLLLFIPPFYFLTYMYLTHPTTCTKLQVCFTIKLLSQPFSVYSFCSNLTFRLFYGSCFALPIVGWLCLTRPATHPVLYNTIYERKRNYNLSFAKVLERSFSKNKWQLIHSDFFCDYQWNCKCGGEEKSIFIRIIKPLQQAQNGLIACWIYYSGLCTFLLGWSQDAPYGFGIKQVAS